MKNRIHEKMLSHCDELALWYSEKLKGSYIPFYSSFDIRDAGFKIGNVDGNIFPAGFNNICQADKEYAPELMSEFIRRYYSQTKNILLLAESHLKNSYYWENVITIRELLDEAGFDVDVGMISDEIGDEVVLESFSGKTIKVRPVFMRGQKVVTATMTPDLVISNNDFSQVYDNFDFSKAKMTPHWSLGWHRRKKTSYFRHYNAFAGEFAEKINEDPWLFQVQTETFPRFDISDETSREALAKVVDDVLTGLKAKYDEHEINEAPYVFIKNNSGTYGLGVIEANSGDEIRQWNYKSKKKMKATKGGGGISEVLIQEGVPSVLTDEAGTAEPVVYMVGDELVGGFLRTHSKKDTHQSLNSPGAVYKRLCLSDLKVHAEGCLLENVYGWVAKLGLLAISAEASELTLD